MNRVENFSNFHFYVRSVDLTKASYNAIDISKNNLTRVEKDLIRKKVVSISIKIASGIAQVNMKVRFKKLNEAKYTLIQLKSIMWELKKRKKIDDCSWQEIEKITVELMKTINGYFGWLRKNKSGV